MGGSPVVADYEPFHARQFPQCRPYGFPIVTRNVRLRTGLYALGFSIGCRTRSRSTQPEGASRGGPRPRAGYHYPATWCPRLCRACDAVGMWLPGVRIFLNQHPTVAALR
jgi:hypothetical protein